VELPAEAKVLLSNLTRVKFPTIAEALDLSSISFSCWKRIIEIVEIPIKLTNSILINLEL